MPALTQHTLIALPTRFVNRQLLRCSAFILLLCLSSLVIAETTETPGLATPSAPHSPPPPPPNQTDASAATNSTEAAGEQVSIEPSAIEPTGPALPTELSALQMYRDADWVVKSVMLLLIGASVMSWTIAIAKSVELTRFQKLLRTQNGHLVQATTLADASGNQSLSNGNAAQMLALVQDEISRSAPAGKSTSRPEPLPVSGIKERAISRLSRLESQQARRFATGTGPLASIGATAPFIGLFGTVWGIMNAFIGISQSQTTNLAVVAPGIAEALLATALGLVAAIPAVLIYNHFSRRITALRAMLGDQSALVLQLLSRDLDRLQATRPAQPEPTP